MGKDLKGKEIGEGISQRRDGRYSARFRSKTGKRLEKYFDKLSDAKQWLLEAKYQDAHSNVSAATDMTVDEWYEFWSKYIIGDLAANTRRNYRERYERNVKPLIGGMKVSDVKPMHCKMILNEMNDLYAGSTIRQTFIAMGTMFRSAVDNDLIPKHPMDGVRYTKPVKRKDDVKYLTPAEEEKFLETAKRSHNYRQYVLLLETGLRTSEMIGLTFDAIDWENRKITVNKIMEFRYKQQDWRAGTPKTKSSYRTWPLTDRAYEILKECYDEKGKRKQSENLNKKLEYMDVKSGCMKTFNMKDLVFVNYRTGMPAKNSSYDTHLYKLCDEAGINRFCMHALRYTYASRAIERGVPPKALQRLLGHASIKTTMDTYVHVSDDSLAGAVKIFEAGKSIFSA